MRKRSGFYFLLVIATLPLLCYNKHIGGDGMKKIYTKIPAIIGMVVNMVGAVLFIVILNVEDRGMGIFLLTLSFLTAVISYFLYIVDAVISIIKVIKKINPILNLVLVSVILMPIPIMFATGQVYINLLALCYAVIFSLELISIVIHIKHMYYTSKCK